MFAFLKYIVRIHPLTAIALTALAVCAWIPDFLSPAFSPTPYIATIVLTMVVGLSLTLVLYRIGITRFYAALPYVLYVLLTAAFPSLHDAWQSQVAMIGVASMVLLLYKSQQQPGVQRTAFAGTILILLSSLFMSVAVWLIPVFWLSLMYIHTLTFRGILSALLAMVVFGLYLAIAQYFFGFSAVYAWPHPQWIMSASVLSIGEVIGLMLCTGLMLVAALYSITRLGKEGSDVRFSVVVFTAILLVGAITSFFPYDGQINIPMVLFASSPVLVNILKQKDQIS